MSSISKKELQLLARVALVTIMIGFILIILLIEMIQYDKLGIELGILLILLLLAIMLTMFLNFAVNEPLTPPRE